MESFTCGESEQPYLTSPTLKVYSPTQVHNLEKIARGDFRSDLGVKVVARREKATTHKRRMAR